MMTEPAGKSLFIVDNSVTDWTGLRYLQEWCDIAKSMDIATGYFEIGALLALDGKWQQLDKIRILMGAEMTHRTRRALLDAVQKQAIQVLDKSLDAAKADSPLLTKVPAIMEALRDGRIEVRVYSKDKFHAKAYITHSKIQVVGSQALVGSSNFTKPGLTQNIELNVQIQNAREVQQLQEWFEAHWQHGEIVTEAIADTVERHVRKVQPFEVYAKALQEYFRGHELTGTEWDKNKSRIFPKLDRYQREAYFGLQKIARQFNGALLCDGVGLGKTYVGLMLLEHLVLCEGKRVVLFAPKAAREGVWEPHLQRLLPMIGGLGGTSDFSNLAVFSHTDLTREGDFPERFQRLIELADAVVIDEAHHFRNPGSGADKPWEEKSRYFRLFDLLGPNAHGRPKSVFLLTATPINNALSDFRHLVELFSRRQDNYFGPAVGINNLKAHFNKLEKDLRKRIGNEHYNLEDHVRDAKDILDASPIFSRLVIQRSRSYARASQLKDGGNAAMFPVRETPKVAAYSIKTSYGKLLDEFERAFQRRNPLFTLAMYYPLAWYKDADNSVDFAFQNNRQKQVVGLIRTNFLKRFESSVLSFELSCARLLRKLLDFAKVHSDSAAEKKRLQRWLDQNKPTLDYIQQQLNSLWPEDYDADEDDTDEALRLGKLERFSPTDYKVDEMLDETFADLDEIARFIEETQRFQPKHDDKLQKLIRLLKSKELAEKKVLIFTEFADTARYLRNQLREAGIDGVDQVDSNTKLSRGEVIRRFAPYYNGSSSGELSKAGASETRILISTDVLSEGLNLQDATRLVNYDIHWNPVRLMQRIGRVDRRMSPEVEARLVADHPEVAEGRGKVRYWNFLPPDDLDTLLRLYTKVSFKTLLISKTLGIEGKQLLTPEDDYNALKEFNQELEGEPTTGENLHLEYQQLVKDHPGLEEQLKNLPLGAFSGKAAPAPGTRAIFFCYAIPGLDRTTNTFTEEAGTTAWYVYDIAKATIEEGAPAIAAQIRCTPPTPRDCREDEVTLKTIRKKMLEHIDNTHLKAMDAPLGVEPILKCWMELHGA